MGGIGEIRQGDERYQILAKPGPWIREMRIQLAVTQQGLDGLELRYSTAIRASICEHVTQTRLS